MEFQGGVSRNVMVVAVGEFVPSCERLLTCLKNLRRLNEFYMNDFIHFGYDMVDPSCAVASDLDLDIHTCKRKGALVLCRTLMRRYSIRDARSITDQKQVSHTTSTVDRFIHRLQCECTIQICCWPLLRLQRLSHPAHRSQPVDGPSRSYGRSSLTIDQPMQSSH